MLLTNKEIYEYTLNLQKEFLDNSLELPVKINFYLQKNKKLIFELAQDIEENRQNIIKKFGIFNKEKNDYDISDENFLQATKEMNELLSLEQEVSLYLVDISDFKEDLILTTGQMEALMFMIKE